MNVASFNTKICKSISCRRKKQRWVVEYLFGLSQKENALMGSLRNILLGTFAAAVAATTISAPAAAQAQQKPNILIIWGDDIGQFNISANNQGMMGYKRRT